MYFVFLLGVIILFIISYRIFDRDIMNPSVLLCFFFAGAIIFGFYLYSFWHLYEYGRDTTFIFLLGITAFIIGSWVAKKGKKIYTIGKRHKDRCTAKSKAGLIEINSVVILGVVVMSAVVFVIFSLYYRTRVTSESIFINIVEYKDGRDENFLPGYINVLIKVLCAFSNTFLYVFINNAIYRKVAVRDWALLIPAAVYCLVSLLSANRGNVLIILMSGIAAWYILSHRIVGWNKRLNGLFLKKGFKIVPVFLIFFWIFMVVTREADTTNVFDSFMTYICSYFSGELASFDLYLRQGGLACEWWGQETFVALNNNLNSLFGIGNASTRFLEFRSGYGRSVVNIYSSFRRFYHDFGYAGVILLSGIQGFITTKMYYQVRRKKTAESIDLVMVIYCFFFYTIPYTLIDEFFYSSNVSFSGIFKLVILIAAYYVTFYKTRYRNVSVRKRQE